MDKLIKSVCYIGFFSTVGYVLMNALQPGPEKIEAIKKSAQSRSHHTNPQSEENRMKTERILLKLEEEAKQKNQSKE